MVSLWKKTLFICTIPSALLTAGISYSVSFKGLDDPKTLRLMRSSSQLQALKKKPPSSINALRFRAESDIPELLKVLKACGYFEAEVDIRIEKDFLDYHAIVEIQPGPPYLIEQYKIEYKTLDSISNPNLCLDELNINIGDIADTKQILDSELCALNMLSEIGFPLAEIDHREIIADGRTKRVRVVITIQTGPLSHFGAIQIEGNCSVKNELIKQQIKWNSKELYNSCLVEETQSNLMDTGLFSSAYITHPKSLDDQGCLPIKIEVAETKHKSVSLGASYQTTFGPGATLGWENRNVGGLGRKISFQADIAKRIHSGVATYQIPNFFSVGQNYTLKAQASFESITPYRMQSYMFLNFFDRTVNPYFYFSIGPKLEYLMVTNSVYNGNFVLVESPIYLRWTNVKNFLNPSSGIRFDYIGVPAVNIKDVSGFYYSQVFTFCNYFPLFDENLILSQKITLGTIICNKIKDIPVPKRFFGGSEDNLRGYKYFTVSMLNNDNKPIGGRSALFYSIEPRIRISQNVGLVPFFDMGNVYMEQFPTFKGKWRKSTGLGFRYYSFIGPLRLDLAFPLNRRKGIDPHWWVFASLGQTF